MKFAIALASATMLLAAPAWAGGVVTRCTTDVDLSATVADPDLAHAVATGGVVTFRCPGGSAVIRMTRAHTLASQTSIDGGGRITLDARGTTAMFEGTAGFTVFLNGLTLRNGANAFGQHGNGVAFGGLVFGPINLVMTDVNVEGTRSAIAVATIDLRGGRFSGNTGTIIRSRDIRISQRTSFIDNPAAIPFAPPSVPGGLEMGTRAAVEDANFNGNLAIAWRGPLSIRRSNFVNNGSDQARGGALWLDGRATIEKTTFVNNRAKDGGAIFVSKGALELRRVRFNGNRAQQSGGAIHLAAEGADEGSELRASYSHFVSNRAARGGAVSLVQGSYALNRFKGKVLNFNGNTATQAGGAIHSHDATIELGRAVFVANTAATTGGAISINGLRRDTTKLGNVLMVRNKAATGGGYYGSQVEFINSTIADNTGGAIRMSLPAGPLMSTRRGSVRLVNSIVSNNDANCPPPQDLADVTGNAMNLQYPGAACGAAAATANPALDAMYVPALDSPARFAGETDVCLHQELVLAKDVFGESRDTGVRCTLGAVERNLERHALKALARQGELHASPIGRYLSILDIRRYRPADDAER